MLKLKKQQKIIALIVGLIALVLLGFFGYKYFFGNTIQVSGQATAKVNPDLITVYFNVDTKGATSAEAQDKNSEITDKLKASIIALGFKESDLKTDSFSIYPEYDWSNGGNGEITGYRATHSLKIETSANKTDELGDIIDAGTNAGAGINYINFELSDALQLSAKTDAIKLAATDARTKAEATAQGFNKRLGRLVSVSLNEFNYYPWNIYASDGATGGAVPAANAEAKSAVASITPSEREVSAYVTAVYKLW